MAHRAFIQSVKFIVLQREDAIGARFEIVQQGDRIELQRVAQFRRVEHPGKIGSLDFAVDHRTGDAEARGLDRVIAAGEKFLQNRDQTGVTLAREIVLGLGVQLFAVHRKQREISLGAADIARENEISMSHGSLLTTKDPARQSRNRNSEYLPQRRKWRKVRRLRVKIIHKSLCPFPITLAPLRLGGGSSRPE